MIQIMEKLSQLRFGELMEVYEEGNRENGDDLYPGEEPNCRRLLAEQDFYQYLSQVFFQTPGAFYVVLEEAGRYVSALRLEPYQDGLLLEALETAPKLRRKGCAAALLRETLDRFGDKPVYSHVHRGNTPSLRTHFAAGFVQILDHAVYIDGSVNSQCVTLRHDPKRKK